MRRLRHLLPRLLHGAQLLLNLAERFPGILEFTGHRRLCLSRDGGGVGDAFLQRARHALEARGHTLAELPELLAEILGLSGQRLQITLQLFRARARFLLFFAPLRALHQ